MVTETEFGGSVLSLEEYFIIRTNQRILHYLRKLPTIILVCVLELNKVNYLFV